MARLFLEDDLVLVAFFEGLVTFPSPPALPGGPCDDKDLRCGDDDGRSCEAVGVDSDRSGASAFSFVCISSIFIIDLIDHFLVLLYFNAYEINALTCV